LYRLIATDVDKTLLDNDSRITEYNRAAIMECRSRGIGIILATGKTMDSIIHLVKDLELELPQITLNGSVTVNPDMTVIQASRIDPGIYMDIVGFIKENGYPPVIALDDGKLYIEEYHPDLEHLDNIGEEFIEVESIQTEHFSRNSVDIYIPIPESHPLDSALRKKYSGRLQFIRSGDYFFDILNKEATKGNALLSVIKDLGVNKGEVAVFGDSPNDLSMFEVAGLSVAVRNAYPQVLERADIITEENYNSGLGKAIFKYILKSTDYNK